MNNSPQGSRRFYETINVPGVKVEQVIRRSPGHVHVTLIADADTDVEALRRKYLLICQKQGPIGAEVTASITKRVPGITP